MEIIEFPIQNASDTQRQLEFEPELRLGLRLSSASVAVVGSGSGSGPWSDYGSGTESGALGLPPIALTTAIRFGCGHRSISLPLPLPFCFLFLLFPFSPFSPHTCLVLFRFRFSCLINLA